MERDIDLDTQSKHTTPDLSNSSEQILNKTSPKQDIETPSPIDTNTNGKPRSKLRMFAILTALFVRRPTSHFSQPSFFFHGHT
jgi:hypothetical protein